MLRRSLLLVLKRNRNIVVQNAVLVHVPTQEAPAPSVIMAQPVVDSELDPAHGALGGIAAPVLEAEHDPPAGRLVVDHPHTGAGLVLLQDEGQDHLDIAVLDVHLYEVLGERALVGAVLLASTDRAAVRD